MNFAVKLWTQFWNCRCRPIILLYCCFSYTHMHTAYNNSFLQIILLFVALWLVECRCSLYRVVCVCVCSLYRCCSWWCSCINSDTYSPIQFWPHSALFVNRCFSFHSRFHSAVGCFFFLFYSWNRKKQLPLYFHSIVYKWVGVCMCVNLCFIYFF